MGARGTGPGGYLHLTAASRRTAVQDTLERPTAKTDEGLGRSGLGKLTRHGGSIPRNHGRIGETTSRGSRQVLGTWQKSNPCTVSRSRQDAAGRTSLKACGQRTDTRPAGIDPVRQSTTAGGVTSRGGNAHVPRSNDASQSAGPPVAASNRQPVERNESRRCSDQLPRWDAGDCVCV
jgi:hypothetical protein